MAFVIDASIIGAWYFVDEYDAKVAALLDALPDSAGLAPAIWWYEVRNFLLVNERRGRIAPARSASILIDLEDLNIQIDFMPESVLLLRFARSYNLSAYDAAYLELAARSGLELATLDRSLAAAARAEGISVLPH
jgi:predicted nucleic acid-binding protein